MNRILFAVLGGGAAVVGYFLLQGPSPAERTTAIEESRSTGSTSVQPEVTPRTVLVDPAVADGARKTAEAGARNEATLAEKEPAKVGGADGASKEKEEERGVPVALPADGDVDPAPFLEKYAAATGEERRAAIESLTLLYKDAAAGRVKDGEKMLPGIQAELDWLERNLDP